MEYLLIITTIITLIGVYAVQRPSLNSHFYLGSEREQIFWKEKNSSSRHGVYYPWNSFLELLLKILTSLL